MIHVAVPDAKTVTDANNSKFHVFSVHINGTYHSSIRYSHLRRLHDLLKTEFSVLELPEFPPKKLRHLLSESQLEERRITLHKYLQSIAQSPAASSHPKIMKFFLEAQNESFRPSTSNVSFDVFQADGSRTPVRCAVDTRSGLVLQIVCHALGIQPENTQHFSLFLVKKNNGKTHTIVRWLKDFESPYISLQLMNQRSGEMHQILVRRCFWDVSIEAQLFSDQSATNLLFAQAVKDVNCGWVQTTADVLQRLRAFQQEKSVKEYLKLCQIQKRHGYMQFNSCTSDYPQPDIRVDLSVGGRQIVLAYPCPATGEPVESVFRVTRIKGWKLINERGSGNLTFTFEYLMARDHFEWITLYSDQSVLLSLCLQSMGAEILKSRGLMPNNGGGSSTVSSSSPASARSLGSPGPYERRSVDSADRYESIRDVFTAKPAMVDSLTPVTNDAFDTITDDDL